MNYPKTDHVRSSRTSRLVYLAVIFGAVCFAFSTVSAQTLDDWKAALSAAKADRGPESIPYSNFRDEVTKKQALVEEFCKRDSWTCDGLGTKSLREEIKGRRYKIGEIRKQREQLDIEKSNAKTDDERRKTQDKIDAVIKETEKESRELEFKEKSLGTDLTDIDIRIVKGAKCLDARTSVQSAFKNAIDKAKGENDPAIKAIATELIAYWEKRQQEHQKAFEVTKAGIDKCQKGKNGDL